MEFELFKYGAAFWRGEEVDENGLESFMNILDYCNSNFSTYTYYFRVSYRQRSLEKEPEIVY
ncbi:hypothetical protein H5410_031876 [Solanum commersonii]|uniref:Uncharacterized protein n=1 Tax=Solanum commersonii TaxID=4109 RepID=A0A9J5YJG9_SOLCO|nr:hypothetical protein H5410_031876 [Solanum commersonii]